MSDGWYPDPYKRHDLRYYGGGSWTEHVSSGGVVAVDRVVPSGTVEHDVQKWWSSEREVSTYLGSHPTRPDRVDNMGIGFLSLGFAAIDRYGEVFLPLGWQDIISVTVETAESIQSRITATRIVLFGWIGLLARKTTRTAYLTIVDPRGEWVFAVEGLDAAGLWSQLLPVKARRPDLFRFGQTPAAAATPSATADVSSTKERLRALDALRSEGLISDAEWATRRAEIIASI